MLWAASDPGAGFRTIALQALAVVHGTGVSELVDIGVLLVLHITSNSVCVTNSILFLECSIEIGHSWVLVYMGQYEGILYDFNSNLIKRNMTGTAGRFHET